MKIVRPQNLLLLLLSKNEKNEFDYEQNKLKN